MKTVVKLAIFILTLNILPAAADLQADVETILEKMGISQTVSQTQSFLVNSLRQEKPPIGSAKVKKFETARDELRNVVTSPVIVGDVIAYITENADAERVAKVLAIFESEFVKQMVEYENALAKNGEETMRDFAAYQSKLTSTPPRSLRTDLVLRLDAAAKATTITTALQYEIAKTVKGVMDTARGVTDVPSENEMDASYIDMRAEIAFQNEEQYRNFLLFVFKNVRSKDLQAYAEIFENPDVSWFTSLCLEAIENTFREKRESLQSSLFAAK